MEEVLSREAGKPVNLTFIPHLVPMSRGMLTTIYVRPAKKVKVADLQECIESFYSGRHFVRLSPYGNSPDTLHVRGTNYCDIGLVVNRRTNALIIVTVIDNLVKGASGQAVQNMNLILGYPEKTAIDAMALFP